MGFENDFKALIGEPTQAGFRNTTALAEKAGVYATHSKWMVHELNIARQWTVGAKPIIAIRPRGNENLSCTACDYSTEVVNWNADSIVNAIRRHALS